MSKTFFILTALTLFISSGAVIPAHSETPNTAAWQSAIVSQTSPPPVQSNWKASTETTQAAPVTTVVAGDAVFLAMLQDCIRPVATNASVEQAANDEKYQTLPPEKAVMFDKKGGKVFVLSSDPGNAVMVTHGNAPICQVLVRQVDPSRFWARSEIYFGAKTPFKMTSDKKLSDGELRVYRADFHGDTALMISVRDQFRPDGIQAVMTFARIKPGE